MLNFILDEEKLRALPVQERLELCKHCQHQGDYLNDKFDACAGCTITMKGDVSK